MSAASATPPGDAFAYGRPSYTDKMQTADWALIISLGSLAISLAGFVWNVWSKFIYPKPRVRVSFSFMIAIGSNEPDFQVLVLAATNMGPTAVTLYAAITRHKKGLRRHEISVLNPLNNFPAERNSSIGPFGGGLPKKLEVGEEFSIYLTAAHDGLAKDDYDQVGFRDTFSRFHWCDKKDVVITRPKIVAALAKVAN
jgi:hypothetical protein